MTGDSEHRRPARRAVFEPTHVIRPRRPKPFSDFSELFRPEDPEDGRGEGWERVPVGGPPPAADRDDALDTEELPPVAPGRAARAVGGRDLPGGRGAAPATGAGGPGGGRREDRGEGRVRGGWPWQGGNRAVVAVAGAAVAGFGAALLLTWNGTGSESRAAEPPATLPTSAPPVSEAPPAPADPAPPTASAPAGTVGVLRQGDSGPQVTEVQERLLRIPDVYTGGSVSGVYDTELTEAIGRFQVWYGIRGDESGVYGDNTRRDLESRTGF
ncbi:peptidoglycan-binding domain-containing protein [Streptomyces paludis]|uniref:peptidoglycan-binding domain-containing protein n=1 Tax=Streptomyces paludis TaxID=2282738 RepID=UPI001E562991|nr:peptidoglycan-binding protein [Streptomyces paludis]